MKKDTDFTSKEKAQKDQIWYLFDAKKKILGRLASEIVKVLRGKHKPDFTPNVDCGDGIVVVNAEKIEVTGNKEAQKVYFRHTRYIGGLKKTPYRKMKKEFPERILFHAVKGMLPKTKLGRKQLKKLRIFRKDDHDMQAQKPIKVNI